MNKAMIEVEVAYAKPNCQRIITILVDRNSTIFDVIKRSGILNLFPEIDLTQQKVGIFSKIRELSFVVKEGDRIEIYRPLILDPKDSRRRRAKSVQLKKSSK